MCVLHKSITSGIWENSIWSSIILCVVWEKQNLHIPIQSTFPIKDLDLLTFIQLNKIISPKIFFLNVSQWHIYHEFGCSYHYPTELWGCRRLHITQQSWSTGSCSINLIQLIKHKPLKQGTVNRKTNVFTSANVSQTEYIEGQNFQHKTWEPSGSHIHGFSVRSVKKIHIDPT